MAAQGGMHPTFSRRRQLGAVAAITLAIGSIVLSSPSAHAADTRSWVVNWFTHASYSQDGDCPAGLNPLSEDQYRQDLKALGKTPDEIEVLMKGFNGGIGQKTREVLANRGRIDGKPVNPYTNPLAVADPHLHVLGGHFAYGFNLDGKGAASPIGFEDPETHEVGVNNQLARALGCIQSHRAMPPDRSPYWSYVWDVIRDSMPGWIITVSGEDLTKDGDVTVGFNRSLDHVARDANGETLAGTAFRMASDPRSRNQYHGHLKGGVVTIEPGDFHMEGDDMLVTQFDIRQTHMRLKLKPDGNLAGIIGGYQTWMPIYFMYGGADYVSEAMVGVDVPGLFYLLKQLADSDPDPTGQNTRISAVYSIEAVPAFAVFEPSGAKDSKTAQADKAGAISQVP